MHNHAVRVGTAGWAIPASSREHFAVAPSQLRRYAARFNCVEINSSFYKAHRASTYARWGESVPESFAFAVKVPKLITHKLKCADCTAELRQFLDDSAHLGEKRRAMLVQLPPSFAFEAQRMRAFVATLRAGFSGFIVCEPRHISWFENNVDEELRALRIARVAADPAICAAAGVPGGWHGIAYYRLHGSPRMYYSAYETAALDQLATTLRQNPASERWCIFDNTSLGAATSNALSFQDLNHVAEQGYVHLGGR